jgi:hypothetical protein
MPAKRKYETDKDRYGAKRDRNAEQSLETSKKARDIGAPNKPERPKIRKKAEASLQFFLETYFPDTFAIAWSDDHLAVIADLQNIIVNGGMKCVAMPRGSGKTSLAIRAALWAVLTGRRRFIIMLAATENLAEKMVAVLRSELQFNNELHKDFKEVTHPIRALENETRRQAGQTCDGVNTMIRMASGEIVFPTVKKSKASGAIVRAAGLTGAIRGQIATTAEGSTIRPDLVLADDPQTRDSAKSPTQTQERESLVNADVLGLAGPKKMISCVMNCTVIYKNDLSDRFLSLDKNPMWGGRRAKLLYSFPTNMNLWDEYAEIRCRPQEQGGGADAATAFYRANREAMDAGAKAGWPDRYNPNELSAIQNAMNLKIDRPKAFASEYQNDPDADALAAGAKELNADEIAKRLSGTERLMVPRECGTVTTFVDAGGYLHWYAVVAWDQFFGGTVIDYGCWPRQTRSHFVASDARPKLADVYPRGGNPERVFAGLRDLCSELAGRRYAQDVTGAEIRCERMLIDAGFESKAVYDFVRQFHAPGMVVLPSKGIARSTTQIGIAGWKPRAGERRGDNWRQTVADNGKGRGQMIQFDPDYWKTFVYERITRPLGGKGVLTLYGGGTAKRYDHTMISEHLSSEYSEPVTLRGTTFDKWQVRPDSGENHWLDCVVGAAVGASVHGVNWTAEPERMAEMDAPKRISFAEQQRIARERRQHV